MTEQTVKEIIKSFAYGLSVKEITGNYGEICRGTRCGDRAEESRTERRWLV